MWMSGSGPAIDGDDIYFTTGNGMTPGPRPVTSPRVSSSFTIPPALPA